MIERPNHVNKIMAFTDAPFVKIITGIRRCGKSKILEMIQIKLQQERGISPERIINYRFDSMEYDDMTEKRLFAELKERIVPEGKTYFFLEEVQKIKGWEKVVNSIQSDYDVDIYVASSGTRMKPSDIATYLTGRYIAFHINNN